MLLKSFIWNTRPDSKPSPTDEILEKISRVAHGEDQVGDDDTEGMAWIAEFVDKHRGLLTDSKPYKYKSATEAKNGSDTIFGFRQSDDPFTAGFNAAREYKEG